MPRILSNLKIDEVSAVDRGAGEGVRIMLTKRDGTPDYQRNSHPPRGAPEAKGTTNNAIAL
jgi:hypothetical protein